MCPVVTSTLMTNSMLAVLDRRQCPATSRNQAQPGADPGGIGAIAPPLKPTKVTFFTMISYNLERHLTAN